MAGINYQEQAVVGTKWRRYNMIMVRNSYGEIPTVNVSAEDVISVPNVSQLLQVNSHSFQTPFNPTSVVNLRNPNTDELTGGTMTHAEIYAILYSVCRQLDDGSQG